MILISEQRYAQLIAARLEGILNNGVIEMFQIGQSMRMPCFCGLWTSDGWWCKKCWEKIADQSFQSINLAWGITSHLSVKDIFQSVARGHVMKLPVGKK